MWMGLPPPGIAPLPSAHVKVLSRKALDRGEALALGPAATCQDSGEATPLLWSEVSRVRSAVLLWWLLQSSPDTPPLPSPRLP